MPKGFYVKVSPYENFRAITNFFVKVTPSSWTSVSDAWVKVSPYSSWVPFFSAATEPASPIEILTTFNSSEELRLQGKNYRWSPSPTTLQYRFRVINKESPSNITNITSLTTTSNPASGTSTTLPGSTSYIDIPKSGSNYYQGATNVFQFLVRATTASGSEVEKVAEYEFRIPAAPTLAIQTLTSTSVRLTITAASSADFNATYRYIIYRYDSTGGFVYSGGGLGGGSASTNPTTRDITGLIAGRQYTFYVLPITGSTGSTPSSHTGYPGVVANIQNTPTAADPQPFTTVSFTKGYPSSSAQGVVRSTTLTWNESVNATRYEIQYQGKTNAGDAWTTVQTFVASPYKDAAPTNGQESQTMLWGSPKPSGGFDYYYFMRASIRASNPDSSVVAYSDGGSAATPVYIEATGTAPTAPSFGTITKTDTTASIPVTISTATGSNYLYTTLEYMYRTSSGSYPASWSTTTISSNAATISLTGLSSSTTYYVKVRVRNYDDLYAENETNFQTNAGLSSPTISSVSFNTSNNTWTVNYSGGSGPWYQIWYQTTASTTTVPALTGSKTSSADAASQSTSSTDRFLVPSSGNAYYWWVRSANSQTATGAGNVSDWSGGVTMEPINTGSPTLTGTTKVGQTLTFGIGSWVNATYYDLKLYRGTANVATFETLAKDAGNVTSSTYLIPSSDFTDANNRKYYRSFADGLNPSYTSVSLVGGTELGPLTNITLYTITFDSQSGSSVSALTQTTEGGSIAKPTDPTRTNYSFGGWATSSSGTTAVSWPRTPTSNETLYAIWTSTATAPGAPTNASIGTLTYAGSTMSTLLSPYTSGNSTKVQTWSYTSTVTFPISYTAGSGATSHEFYMSSSSTAPTTQNATHTSNPTASQVDRGTITRYVWVRARNDNGVSAWVSAGSKTSTATVVSGLAIKICRLGTTTCTAGVPSSQNALSYTYTGVNTAYSHDAYASATISGVALDAFY